MSKQPKSPESAPLDAAALRHRAEEIFREKAPRSQKPHAPLSPDETRQRLHELRVHQRYLDTEHLRAIQDAHLERIIASGFSKAAGA